MNSPKDKIIFDNPYELASYVTNIIGKAQSYDDTSRRLAEAHEYVHKYLMPNNIGWGKNVWHSILDDAIKMRNEKK